MQHPAITSCLCFKSLSYTFTFPVKTGKPLFTTAVLFCLLEASYCHNYHCCKFIDIQVWLRVTPQLLKSYWYSCVPLESNYKFG